ncbi:uncharacterized protein LOC121757696, partial [Salvia splendens]|uniref:uncharacterized protein LOC121757696 n=1 Tax=Salvia splendens TaxID=180675 RepID=UPI001C275228
MKRFNNNGKAVGGSSRPDSFPNGASRRQQPVDRRNFGNSHQSQLEDGEFEVRQPEELHLDDSVSGKLDRLLDRLDKFEVWRADTDRRFQSLEPVISRDAEPPSVFEDGDDWGDKGFRRTRYGDRGNNFRNPSGGFRDSQQAGRGSRGGRGRPGSCWDPPWTRTCWDPPAYRETPRQHPFNEDHGGRHSTTWDSPWGRGDSGRQSPLLSTATTVASQPLLGFNGRSSRATHQPLSSEALWWDRYGSGGEGVRGRRPTAWDNPPQRVDDHTGRLAPTWETARGRHEDDRYSDPPRRIDASERRAAIAQPPAPAVASIPRLGFGDDSSIHGPQQATQPGASSGARYTVKGDGDRGKQPSASVAIEAPSSSTTDLLLQAKDLSVVIAESKQPILKEVNLTVRHGEVHAVMGKNDSGKSTFAKALAGHPDYEVTGGSVMYKGFDLREMESEERATVGLFMSFQSSVEIPGVSNIDFLNMAYNARRRELGLPELGPIEFYGYVAPKLELINMKTDFLNRYVNEGFSGGEKRRNDTSCLSTLGSMDKLFVLGWNFAAHIGCPLLFNDGGDEVRRLVVRCVFDPGGDVSPKSAFNSLRCFVVSTLRTRWILTVGELIRSYILLYLLIHQI